MANIEDQIKDLQKLADRLADSKLIQDRVTTVAALETFAEYKDRIFADGRATNLSRIGDYDTKPYYVGKSQLKGLPKSKFKPKGKDGKSKFKSGKSKKSTYVSKGYFEFRKLAGRQNKFADLNLTGASARSIQPGTKGDLITFGFTDEKRRKILEAQEIHFKKIIFTLSVAEQKTFQDAAAREMRFIIRQGLA